jgi:hypothetical protein
VVDEQRFEELSRKRFEEGLTDEEADELGRMMAEREGKPYRSAEDRPSADDQPMAWDEAAKRGEEESLEEQATPEPADDHRPEEERAVGTERQPIGPAGSGYAPPKGGTEIPEDDAPSPAGTP